MKDPPPQYPWKTKVELAIQKAQELHDRLSSMPATKDIEFDRWTLRRRLEHLLNAQAAFDEIEELVGKYR